MRIGLSVNRIKNKLSGLSGLSEIESGPDLGDESGARSGRKDGDWFGKMIC